MSDDEDIARLQRAFGGHVHSLRRARRLTQENLAERSQLSADTIRRLEHGGFSPTLQTLVKLCRGLGLMLSTLFESFEVGARDQSRELIDLLAGRTPSELELALQVLRGLFDAIDGVTPEYRDGQPGRERGGRGIRSPA